MAESDDSEFGSVTSSQKSFLNHCPFADPNSVRPTQSSDGEVLETVSDNTEVLGNLISPPVVVTPVISYSSRTSVDSINDDVFRTPPENPSLSSAPDSQTRVRVSELRSPSSPVSASPSLPVVNVRVSEMTNRRSDSVEPLSSPSPVTAVDARVSNQGF
ncbi:unnamed protein product [Arabis nemorensis]|uniref:Uncharacterized protein n=1 Tax=Arabis nemorensis TaxID=586526 RepID=A0A565C5I8_9BRAS|nr:unnamed protein product [Arabis nemorensis]